MYALWLILLADFTFFTSRCLIMSILYAYVENCHTCSAAVVWISREHAICVFCFTFLFPYTKYVIVRQFPFLETCRPRFLVDLGGISWWHKRRRHAAPHTCNLISSNKQHTSCSAGNPTFLTQQHAINEQSVFFSCRRARRQ